MEPKWKRNKRKEKLKGKVANNAQCELETQRVVVHAGIDATKNTPMDLLCYVCVYSS